MGDSGYAWGRRQRVKRVLLILSACLLLIAGAVALGACGTRELTKEEYDAYTAEVRRDYQFSDSGILGAIASAAAEGRTGEDSRKFSEEDIAAAGQDVEKFGKAIKKLESVKPPAEYADLHDSHLAVFAAMKELLSRAASLAEGGATVGEVLSKLSDEVSTLGLKMQDYARAVEAAGGN